MSGSVTPGSHNASAEKRRTPLKGAIGDADHGHLTSIHGNRLANGRRTTIEQRCPETIADDCRERWVARIVVGRPERPPGLHADAEHVEVRPGDELAVDESLGTIVGADRRTIEPLEGGHIESAK